MADRVDRLVGAAAREAAMPAREAEDVLWIWLGVPRAALCAGSESMAPAALIRGGVASVVLDFFALDAMLLL